MSTMITKLGTGEEHQIAVTREMNVWAQNGWHLVHLINREIGAVGSPHSMRYYFFWERDAPTSAS